MKQVSETSELGNPIKFDDVSKSLSFSYDDICRINASNYEPCNIIIDSFSVDLERKGNGYNLNSKANLFFREDNNTPCVKWNHISMPILMDFINQGGKLLHNEIADPELMGYGVALINTQASFRKEAPLKNITKVGSGKVFVKMNKFWLKGKWEFFHADSDKPFATIETLSTSVQRDYSLHED